MAQTSKAQQRLAEAVRHHQAGRLKQAEALYNQVLRAHPGHVEALCRLGILALQAGRNDQAIAVLQSAVKRQPGLATAHNYLGVALKRAGRLREAAESYRNAIERSPKLAAAYSDLGCVYQEMDRVKDAVEAQRKALALQPDLIQAHHNLASAYLALGMNDEAVASSRRALALNDGIAEIHHLHGLGLEKQGRLPDAVAAYEYAVRLNPDGVDTINAMVYLLRRMCRWDDVEVAMPQLLRAVERNEGECVTPQHALCMDFSAAWQLKNARAFVAKHTRRLYASVGEHRFEFGPAGGGPITIGYLSGDFRVHPVATLVAELFERHDRERFRVHGYSCGPDDGSDLRGRIRAACDRFADIRALDPLTAARQIHADGVDILVDLSGPTEFGRIAVPALRPAPIQVSYLGFSGTSGAAFMDYIVVDPFLVPMEERAHFAEHLAQLPDCYMVNDSNRAIAPTTPTRAEAGLPEDGFVFCAFNDPYKITPRTFDVWADLLRQLPGSVLWLRETNPYAAENLVRAATERGIEPQRLVFAPRVESHAEHLARHRLADLFLDTFPSYAHTSASDALWVGLPVLTCAGDTFASRVAGSLLHAIGLPDLIVDDVDAYRERALALARDPAALRAVRERLVENRDNGPVFDCGRFARHLEKAYEMMWERHRAGQAPAPLVVPRLFAGATGAD